ncbi:MAG: hypothetical protein ACREOG_05605 [Gemmatimonadaceae bacterium]
MAETKDFTCRVCGAQFDARVKLDKHNRREHGAHGQYSESGSEPYGDAGTPSSGKPDRSGMGSGGTPERDSSRQGSNGRWED